MARVGVIMLAHSAHQIEPHALVQLLKLASFQHA